MIKALKGAIGFLSTLPAGRSPEEFESFRKSVEVMPFAGLIIGIICGMICYLFSLLSVQFLTPLAFLAVEGINHLDGLADVGDAIFAPESKKFSALKDLNTGVGGVVSLLMWMFAISFSSLKMNPEFIFLTAVLSEVVAKTCMMLMLSTTKPLWTGLGSYMMEFASFDESAKSAAMAGGFALFLRITFSYPALTIFVVSLLLFLLLRWYFLRTFGGVNGDMFGATNSIAIAFTFVLARCMNCLHF